MRLARLGVVLTLLAGTASGCFGASREDVTLRVLASSELADMQPLLDQLRDETGVTLSLDLRGTVDAANALEPGRYQHDLAWLSTDKYFQLKLNKAGYTGNRPLSTPIMTSPVVIGVTPEAAAALRKAAPGGQVSWADLADQAAAGALRFAMADPTRSGSGMAALVGVATAATGRGGVLRPEDVTCDRLRGLFAGHTVTAPDTRHLMDEVVSRQADLDAVISYESSLLTLNASGKLKRQLEIVYPRDGIVQADYPLLLLDPAKRTAYDTAVAWLKKTSTQQQIMELTLRRPLDPAVQRDPRLQAVGNALYFPDQQDVVDKLLADYADPSLRLPDRVIFVLDFSGSMRGARIAAVRDTFAGFAGFSRFYKGEQVTLIRFGGQVLSEQDFTIDSQADLDTLQAALRVEAFDDSTAIWSALDHAYTKAATAAREHPQQKTSIVLMTDGDNNAGISLSDFLAKSARPHVSTFTISYGQADAAQLAEVARATGGFMVDAKATSLLNAFKEIRGC